MRLIFTKRGRVWHGKKMEKNLRGLRTGRFTSGLRVLVLACDTIINLYVKFFFLSFSFFFLLFLFSFPISLFDSHFAFGFRSVFVFFSFLFPLFSFLWEGGGERGRIHFAYWLFVLERIYRNYFGKSCWVFYLGLGNYFNIFSPLSLLIIFFQFSRHVLWTHLFQYQSTATLVRIFLLFMLYNIIF
jgi:hypothetical protein